VALGFAVLALLAALAGQAFAGWHDFNNDQLRHQSPAISFGRYVVSSEFGRAIWRTGSLSSWPSGRWPSFAVYLRQRGSPESKPVGAAHGDTSRTG